MSDERCTLVSGNWKMHKDHLEALKLVRLPSSG
jgi:triosephosphate isomerase